MILFKVCEFDDFQKDTKISQLQSEVDQMLRKMKSCEEDTVYYNHKLYIHIIMFIFFILHVLYCFYDISQDYFMFTL